jgi:hypothetical protein
MALIHNRVKGDLRNDKKSTKKQAACGSHI